MRWLVAVALLLMVACKREGSTVEEAGSSDVGVPASDVAVAVAADAGVPKPSMELEAKRLLERWDSAYNTRDPNAIAAQYAPSVRWFGATLVQTDCRDKIMAYLAKLPDQKQTSVLDSVLVVPDGVRVNFTKTLTNGEKSKPYPSYFHLSRSMAGGLRIDEESDPLTDKNLKMGTCEDALGALLREAYPNEGAVEISKKNEGASSWSVVRSRKGGFDRIDYDPKTKAFTEGMGEVLTPFAPPATLTPRVDAVKSKCK